MAITTRGDSVLLNTIIPPPFHRSTANIRSLRVLSRADTRLALDGCQRRR